MRRSNSFPRGLFLLFLLAGLCAGLVGPRLAGTAKAAPVSAFALDVIINEIAWSGTQADANDEWIELYNPTGADISLSGWVLQATDGTPNISLSGSILAGGYYLLERTDNTTISDINADLIYTGALGDPGETLTLYDNSATPVVIDTANGNGGGWPFGTGAPNRFSMERRGVIADSDTAWASNDGITRNGLGAALPVPNPINGTPKQQNSAFTGYSSLDILINEVAWAGTMASPDDEWIELYNPGGSPISLDGWRLVADDGSPDISLDISKSIPAGGYYLLERGRQQVTSIPYDQLFFGALDDTDEILRLRAPDGSIVDTANSDGGAWPSGSLSQSRSMERVGVVADDRLTWVTFDGIPTPGVFDAAGNPVYGTPGIQNWGWGQVPTPTPLPTFTSTVTQTSTGTSTSTPTQTSTPAVSMAVLINEVAWMGTLSSSSDEWIELYNPGLLQVNLSGWKLSATDGTPTINLSGTIPAGGYFVLATNSSVFDDLTPDMTYSGSLSNSGEILSLYDSTNVLVDRANSDSGDWPAGVASPTYASMERRGVIADGFFAWSTYANPLPPPYPDPLVHDDSGNVIKGTPGQPNWGPTVTLTPTATATLTRTPTSTRTSKPPPTSTKRPTVQPVGRPIINEYLPRPNFDWNQDGRIDVFDEYIEIINVGPVDSNLKGWKLDDEDDLGSSPYTLPSVTLKPGQRIIFYGLETNILLGDGGDTVRLINPGGTVMDAHTYSIARNPDQSWCRLPDGPGYWYDDCLPTPNQFNKREGQVPSMPPGNGLQPAICSLPDTLPPEVLFAECNGYGSNMWRSMYWDEDGWQGDQFIPENTSKWDSFVE